MTRRSTGLDHSSITGVRSSRTIEKRCIDDVLNGWLAAGAAPDYRAIARFRKRHLRALAQLFPQALKLCQAAGMVRLGRLALDGTKVRASASKRKAMSYAWLTEKEKTWPLRCRACWHHAEQVDRPRTPSTARTGAAMSCLLSWRVGRAGQRTRSPGKRLTATWASARRRDSHHSRKAHPRRSRESVSKARPRQPQSAPSRVLQPGGPFEPTLLADRTMRRRRSHCLWLLGDAPLIHPLPSSTTGSRHPTGAPRAAYGPASTSLGPDGRLTVVSTVSSAVDTVEAEVRELVRRRGLDPVEDRLAMRRLIDEIVLDYDERSLSSTMPQLPDPRQAARAVYDAVAGFGPLQRHLDDPEVEETGSTGD